MPQQEDGTDPLASATKHAFPSIVVPDPLPQPSQPMFPEVFVSVYADQEVEVSYGHIRSEGDQSGLNYICLDRSSRQGCRFMSDQRRIGGYYQYS